MSTSYVNYILRFRDNVTKGLRRVRTQAQMTDNSVKGIQTSLGGLFAVAGAAYGARQLMKYGAELQKVEKSFEVLVGNKAGAESLLGNVSEYAKNTNFGKMGLAQSAQDLLTYGVNAEKVMPTLEMLGDISLGNQEKLRLLSYAYAQVQGAGKLMGQDLLQLINAGFNPLQIISQQTGQTMGELRQAMEKGAISADMVTEAMKIATSEGGRFFNGANALAETGAGRFDRMNETIMETAQVIGSNLLDALVPVFDIMTNLFEFMSAHIDTLMVVGAVVGTLSVGVLAWWGATKLMIVAQSLLNAVMMANPVGLVILAIAGLVAGVVAAYNRFDKFREVVDTVWVMLKKFGSGIKSFVSSPLESLNKLFANTLAPFFEAIALVKEGNFWGAAKALGRGVLNISPFGLVNSVGKMLSAGYSSANEEVKAGASLAKDVKSSGVGKAVAAAGAFGGFGTVGTTSSSLKSGLNSITGSAPKTFNINIERLTGIETLSTTTMKEGLDEMEEKLLRILTNVLNDSQNLATS